MSIYPDLPMKRSYSHQTTVGSLLSFLGFSHADSVSTFPPCGLERGEDDERIDGRRKRRRGVGERLRNVVGKFMRSQHHATICDTITADPDPKHDPLSTISSDQLTAREFASLAHIKVLVMSDQDEEDQTTFSTLPLEPVSPTSSTTILDPTFFNPPPSTTPHVDQHRTAIHKVGRFTVIVESNSLCQPPMRTSNESRNSTSGASRDVMEEFPELRRFRAQSQPQAVA
ncbi:hypothetical protein SpCBS45565_g06617 [Spizellomyces sp. 'palustris']|nr:hypothetical protein SpCBS45565_g06617 [Spizellomyces sp. 'palustris']